MGSSGFASDRGPFRHRKAQDLVAGATSLDALLGDAQWYADGTQRTGDGIVLLPAQAQAFTGDGVNWTADGHIGRG